MRAVLQVNMLNTKTIWYHESSNDLFAATMSMDRVRFCLPSSHLMIKSSEMNVGNMTSLLVYANFLKK